MYYIMIPDIGPDILTHFVAMPQFKNHMKNSNTQKIICVR
jgi:hypothetical protein